MGSQAAAAGEPGAGGEPGVGGNLGVGGQPAGGGEPGMGGQPGSGGQPPEGCPEVLPLEPGPCAPDGLVCDYGGYCNFVVCHDGKWMHSPC